MDVLRPKTKNRYRVVEGRPIIELMLKTPHQLFDERDPAPFRERDLDDEAAQYIISSYEHLPSQKQAKLSLSFTRFGEFEDSPQTIQHAIHSFFQYEAEEKRRKLKTLFTRGFISLGIGLSFLFACIYISHGANIETNSTGVLTSFLHEGLLLMGWVSMWNPINIFLYEWWPLYAEEQTLKELSQIEIEVLSAESAFDRAATQAPARAPKASLYSQTS